MPDNDTHEVTKLSQHQIDALADRMFNRAVSMLTELHPGMRADLLTAVAIMRAAARDCPDDGLPVRIFRGGN